MQHIIVTNDQGLTERIAIDPTLPAAGERTLAQCIYTHGSFPPPALCAGLGRCGRCRMRITAGAPLPRGEDALYFDEKELQDGWRLGCHHLPQGGMEIMLPPAPRRMSGEQRLSPSSGPLRLAVDLGTTSLHWSLLSGSTRLCSGQELNPQMGAGSEVMSRLAFARTAEGAATLRSLVQDRLRALVADLEHRAGAPIAECCIAGNSVMTALLLGLDTAGLAAAPYRLEFRGGCEATVEGLAPIYVPPLPAPFVGGDLSAGMAAVLESGPRYPFLLADMGTNGEFVLALGPDRALVTSVALGPALEGIGLTFGTVAQPGVITRFSLTPTGLVPVVMQGNSDAPGAPQEVTGISGTGYLSLVHTLLKAGLIQPDGRFARPPYAPLAARLAKDLIETCGERRFRLTDELHLSGGDVEELLKVKAAFTLAFERLLAEAGITSSELGGIHIAGALGSHIEADVLEGLGFIPAGAGDRLHGMGNTSLRGAELFLVDPSLRTVAEVWTAATQHVDLTTDPAFTQNFMRHMRFIHS